MTKSNQQNPFINGIKIIFSIYVHYIFDSFECGGAFLSRLFLKLQQFCQCSYLNKFSMKKNVENSRDISLLSTMNKKMSLTQTYFFGCSKFVDSIEHLQTKIRKKQMKKIICIHIFLQNFAYRWYLQKNEQI